MLSCAPDDFFVKEIDIPEQDVQTRLTLNAIAEVSDSTDNILVAFLTKSTTPSKQQKTSYISNAVITLWEEDQHVSTGQYKDVFKYHIKGQTYILSGFVFDSHPFTHGKKYTLKVSAQGYPPVQSSQYLPYPAKITNWNYIPEGYVDPLDETTYDLIEIQLEELRQDQALLIQVADSTEQFIYFVTRFSSEYIQHNSYSLLVRSKDLANAAKGIVRIPIIPPEFRSTKSLIVHLHHINLDHFRFLRDYSFNKDKLFLYDYVPITSNVEGGNGLFALEYVQKIVIHP